MTVTIPIKISAKAIDFVEDMEIIIFPQRKIPNRTNKEKYQIAQTNSTSLAIYSDLKKAEKLH